MPLRSEAEEELLAFACYRIISRYKDSEGRVDGLRFNKMMSLLDNRLRRSETLDLKVPSCWYFYGEEVVPNEMPAPLDFEPRRSSGDELSWYRWNGGVPSPDSRKKALVSPEIDRLYSQYPPDESVFRAVEDDYEFAPFEFQKKYKDFRSDTLMFSNVDPDGTFRAKAFYGPGIRAAFMHFPFDEFRSLKVPATQVEILTSAIFENRPTENRHAISLAKVFWEIFCKQLRAYSGLEKSGYKYVSAGRLENWRKEAEEVLKEYRVRLDSQIPEILALLPDDAIDDPMEQMFLEPLAFETKEETDDTLYS